MNFFTRFYPRDFFCGAGLSGVSAGRTQYSFKNFVYFTICFAAATIKCRILKFLAILQQIFEKFFTPAL
jgi:hypothetical protein